MSARTKKQQPLTKVQQEIVIQWRPLACRYVLLGLRRRGLAHFMDEVDGLAADALVRAVGVWVPERGGFASCLKWWVRYVMRHLCAHGARVVHQSERATSYVDAWSLNAPVTTNRTETEFHGTWQDLLADETASDPAEDVDARRLARAVPLLLPVFMARKNERRNALAYAEESFRLWHLRTFSEEDVTLDALASQMGVSRERIRQRVEKVQEEFERWAKPIREEAA
jgi:hypothetical protein